MASMRCLNKIHKNKVHIFSVVSVLKQCIDIIRVLCVIFNLLILNCLHVNIFTIISIVLIFMVLFVYMFCTGLGIWKLRHRCWLSPPLDLRTSWRRTSTIAIAIPPHWIIKWSETEKDNVHQKGHCDANSQPQASHWESTN